MYLSSTNIYPLNEINLQALLDYYFPKNLKINIVSFCSELVRFKISLKELEYLAVKILPFINLIEQRLGGISTQVNLLDYSVEIFFEHKLDYIDRDPQRIEIIKYIKSIIGVEEDYEDMLSRRERLIITKNWN